LYVIYIYYTYICVMYVYAQIYWPDDDSWYSGKVESFNAETSYYEILYDDDATEQIDLSQHQVYILLLLLLLLLLFCCCHFFLFCKLAMLCDSLNVL
jgi:hypothetical protein